MPAFGAGDPGSNPGRTTIIHLTTVKIVKSDALMMEPSKDELIEAKRQIDSILYKLTRTISTLESKEDPHRCRSQITLAKRRVHALEIANRLIDKELEDSERGT